MNGNFILKGADSLLMLCVVRVASSSLIANEYGDAHSMPYVLLWYGLVTLYAVTACFTRDMPHRGLLKRLGSALSAAAGLCCAGISLASPLTPANAPMGRLDWAAMGLCFLCSAAYHRLFPRR